MSLPTTTGVELELWVVDERGRLSDGAAIVEAHDRIEPEFVPPLVEVKTAPHDDAAALRRDLHEVLRAAIEAAAADGLALVPLGTPLTRADPPATTTRGRVFERVYGDGVESAKNCAGTHVHFEKGEVRRQLNLLTALDPALALVSSSPYYCGERDMDSSRAFAYRNDCGREFRQFCGLWSYVDDVEEWTDRVDSAYGTFKSLADDRGVDPATIDELFCPENTVLNPVRLRHEQPTVEWRAPDAALPSQVLDLAIDVGRLVAETEDKPLEFGPVGVTDDRIGVPEFDDLWDLSRWAIRGGLGPGPVEEYLRSMGFDPDEYDPISPELRGPPTLTPSEARALRLRYADRLRVDVRTLTDDPSDELEGPPDLQLA